MSRIRTVKPELFTHEALYDAEIAHKLPLRLAFIGLFTCCDRSGRFRWQPRRLKLDIFPYDDIDVSLVLDALQLRGFIVKYKNHGEIYGCIPSWLRHQHINNREISSKLPAVDESSILEIKKLNIINRTPNNFSPETDMSLTRDSSVNDSSGTCADSDEKEKITIKNTPLHELNHKENNNLDEIHHIFAHWKMVMNHPNSKLDQKRRTIIAKALKFGYGVDELCDAITGCSYTAHNIGNNDRGQRYDGLHIILRDGDQIDRFIHNCKFPPRPITAADRLSMSNIATLKSWASKKIAEEK